LTPRLLGVVAAILIAGCGSSAGSARTGRTTTSTATKLGGSSGGVASAAGGPRQVPRLVLPASSPARSVRVPILTYHRVHDYQTEYTKSIPDETVEPGVFAAEMAALARGGYHTISQVELFHALFDGAGLPAKPVMITVDDGYVDDVRTILPVLERHHMVATFYVITGRYHEQGFLNETEVRRLDQAGMDLGAHTRTHVPLNAVPAAEVRDQVVGSRRDLQRVLGHFVYFFAYPYGAFSPAVVAEVRRAGFVLAVTTMGGTTESSAAPLTLPRIHVGRSQTPAGLIACVRVGGCGGGGT
jgi:peptidoglycan/xylan/chitin deacetylase (PgdA/CDA1 family)